MKVSHTSTAAASRRDAHEADRTRRGESGTRSMGCKLYTVTAALIKEVTFFERVRTLSSLVTGNSGLFVGDTKRL